MYPIKNGHSYLNVLARFSQISETVTERDNWRTRISLFHGGEQERYVIKAWASMLECWVKNFRLVIGGLWRLCRKMQSLILIDCLVVDICRFCCSGGLGVSGHKTGHLCDGPGSQSPGWSVQLWYFGWYFGWTSNHWRQWWAHSCSIHLFIELVS